QPDRGIEVPAPDHDEPARPGQRLQQGPVIGGAVDQHRDALRLGDAPAGGALLEDPDRPCACAGRVAHGPPPVRCVRRAPVRRGTRTTIARRRPGAAALKSAAAVRSTMEVRLMSNGSDKLKRLHPWIAAAAFGLGAFLVHRALQRYSMDEIVASLGAISADHIALGAAFTAGSFFCLSLSDTLAVRYTGSDLPYPKIALASFTALSIGHLIGFAALSSGAVRYRFYTAWGLSPGDVGRIVLFCAMTVAVGLATGGGIASVAQPALVGEVFRITPGAAIAVGGLLLLLVLIYLGLAAFVHRPLRIRRFRLPVPPLRRAFGR